MYTPAHFQETDAEEIAALVSENPLATLIAMTARGICANHVPVLRDDAGRLFGHLALNNDLHRDIAQDSEVLVIFHGENAYISPNWYPSKAVHHKQVPTWNYQVVHMHGKIRFSHDDKVKRAVVGRMTKALETLENGRNGWRMADAPAEFMDEMLKNIVAFEVLVDRVEATTKLSQNKTPDDRQSVADKMAAKGKAAMTARMAKAPGG